MVLLVIRYAPMQRGGGVDLDGGAVDLEGGVDLDGGAVDLEGGIDVDKGIGENGMWRWDGAP